MRRLCGSRVVVLAGVLAYVAGMVRVSEWHHNRRWHPGGRGVARCQAQLRCPAHARARAAREREGAARVTVTPLEWEDVAAAA